MVKHGVSRQQFDSLVSLLLPARAPLANFLSSAAEDLAGTAQEKNKREKERRRHPTIHRKKRLLRRSLTSRLLPSLNRSSGRWRLASIRSMKAYGSTSAVRRWRATVLLSWNRPS